ncbi:TPA: hypothetical protein ACPY9W_004570 [Klebsiella aerogenes]|uniref:hypothetical protein n=1 Tax=Klebsiella aerogenes TaxID=548 RepID=UPI0027EED67E|nr:hypothetical protein [Klebsiella aerogenes]HDU3462891.1 hypothetical protein [Klebsiella aerogenes]
MILHSSAEIEIGRTGEFFTLFALAKQGFQCCLSAQMLPYDIVVDVGDMVLRGQVKSTLRHGDFGKSRSVYRFSMRCGKGSKNPREISCTDFYAFVAIEDEKIAFIPSPLLESKNIPGMVMQMIELRSSDMKLPGRTYSNGTVREANMSKCFEYFDDFNDVVDFYRENKNG